MTSPAGDADARPLVLIVDDAAENRLLLTKTVADMGLHTMEAADGEAAVMAVLSHRPDLVILDIVMPRLDGLEALEQIRQEDVDVPVVVVTAADDPRYAERALELGAVSFLRRPLDPSEIRFIVGRILGPLDDEADFRMALPFVCERRTGLQIESDLKLVAPTVSYLLRELRLHYPGSEVPVPNARLALHEALMNAMEHGNLQLGYEAKSRALQEPGRLRSLLESRTASLRQRKVQVAVEYAADRVTYRIRDQGPGFTPQGADKPWRSGDVFARHGRGIMMIEHSVDEVAWNSEGNEIRMTLRVGSRGE